MYFLHFVCFTLQIKYQRHRRQLLMSNSVSIHHGFVGLLMENYKRKLSINDFFLLLLVLLLPALQSIIKFNLFQFYSPFPSCRSFSEVFDI